LSSTPRNGRKSNFTGGAELSIFILRYKKCLEKSEFKGISGTYDIAEYPFKFLPSNGYLLSFSLWVDLKY